MSFIVRIWVKVLKLDVKVNQYLSARWMFRPFVQILGGKLHHHLEMLHRSDLLLARR